MPDRDPARPPEWTALTVYGDKRSGHGKQFVTMRQWTIPRPACVPFCYTAVTEPKNKPMRVDPPEAFKQDHFAPARRAPR